MKLAIFRIFKSFGARLPLAALLLLASLHAQAFVECSVTPYRYYVGDDGALWVFWNQGGAGSIAQSDPDFKATFATVVAGLLAGRQMTVRYNDGANCAAAPVPIIGIWLF